MTENLGPVATWFDIMKSIWLEKKPDDIAYILSDNIEYFESPLEPPLTSKAEIAKAWQAIKDQNIELLEIQILYETLNVGMATWRFQECGLPLHVGCYYLELNDTGECKVFRQWWNEDTKSF